MISVWDSQCVVAGSGADTGRAGWTFEYKVGQGCVLGGVIGGELYVEECGGGKDLQGGIC